MSYAYIIQNGLWLQFMPSGGGQPAGVSLAAGSGTSALPGSLTGSGSGGSMLEHLLSLRSASAAEAAWQDTFSTAAAPRQHPTSCSLLPTPAGLASWQLDKVSSLGCQ